jgi:hypothetical protein
MACSNERSPHPSELFGDDWQDWNNNLPKDLGSPDQQPSVDNKESLDLNRLACGFFDPILASLKRLEIRYLVTGEGLVSGLQKFKDGRVSHHEATDHPFVEIFTTPDLGTVGQKVKLAEVIGLDFQKINNAVPEWLVMRMRLDLCQRTR